ncbi:MAG: SDR family NAD(P)-dependent oxidoreductase [Bacteroidales bacterium]|nr:SDR family NAD(P)-dependent oxidoreductase [Bacteroidales bacterium]
MEVKTVLLTGGSSGIGAATALMLAKYGMKVYAASRRGTVTESHPSIVPVKLDVNDAETTRLVVERIIQEEGHLDAVVCNAGAGIYGPLEGTTEEEAREQFETTYFGSLKTIEACLPAFRRQGFGRIITVTSVMAILQLPFQSLYSSAKAALLSLSQSLSLELKGSGIECCSILPGDVATGFTSARKKTAAALDEGSPYKARMEKNLAKIEKDELGGMSPDVIASAICRQLRRRHMAVRVIPRIDYKAVGFLVRVLPAKWVLAILNMIY